MRLQLLLYKYHVMYSIVHICTCVCGIQYSACFYTVDDVITLAELLLVPVVFILYLHMYVQSYVHAYNMF